MGKKAEAVFAWIDQIGRWKPIKDGRFRILNRGRFKGKFEVRYLAGQGRWKKAVVATIKVPAEWCN
jgi:hypothetical protein